LPGTTAVRREWFERMGGFDRDVRLSEDWHFYMKLATQGCPMAWVREYTVRYRQHSDSLVRNLGRHLEDSLRVLERVLAQPQPEHVRAMGPAARAWAHVVFAGKALAAGQSGLAHRWLREALQLDPSLGNRQRAMLTESLLRPPVDWTRSPIAYGRSVAPHLPPELRLTPLELRRVLARLEMREFFRETDHGHGPGARGHLAAAIRQDPTWLANRGVLAFLARGMQPRLRRA